MGPVMMTKVEKKMKINRRRGQPKNFPHSPKNQIHFFSFKSLQTAIIVSIVAVA